MGVTQINLDDTPERKCTKYGLAHQIPPDLSVRHILNRVQNVLVVFLSSEACIVAELVVEDNACQRFRADSRAHVYFCRSTNQFVD